MTESDGVGDHSLTKHHDNDMDIMGGPSKMEKGHGIGSLALLASPPDSGAIPSRGGGHLVRTCMKACPKVQTLKSAVANIP